MCDRREAAWLEELERQAEIGRQMQWVSVVDRLPENYANALVYTSDNCLDVGSYFADEGGYWQLSAGMEDAEVTHWMPIEPPKEAE